MAQKREKIIQFIDHYCINLTQLGGRIGYTTGYLSMIMSRKRPVSAAFLEKMNAYFNMDF